MEFLIDTGAAISVLPRTPTDKQSDLLPALVSANGTPIKTYGQRSLTLELGLRRNFRWIFTIADVTKPIIGHDFLHHFGLIVDVRRRKLYDETTSLSTFGHISTATANGITFLLPSFEQEWIRILKQFPALTKPISADQPIMHDVNHHIETTGPPKVARPRRLPPDKLKAAKEEFQHIATYGQITDASTNGITFLLPSFEQEWIRILNKFPSLDQDSK